MPDQTYIDDDDHFALVPLEQLHEVAARAPIEGDPEHEAELREWKLHASRHYQRTLIMQDQLQAQAYTIGQLKAQLARAQRFTPARSKPRREQFRIDPLRYDTVEYVRVPTGKHDFFVEAFGVALRPSAAYVILNNAQLRADVNTLRAQTQVQLVDRASDRIVAEGSAADLGGVLEHLFPRWAEVEFRMHFPSAANTRELNYHEWAAVCWLRGRTVFDHGDLTRSR